MRKKLHYSEGTVFGVPLDCGGYGLGVIARMTPQGKVLFCYFFGPRLEDLPAPGDVQELDPAKAVLKIMVGDLGLYRNEWPVVDQMHNWDRREWPYPVFVRREDLAKRAHFVYYSDTDPNEVVREERAPYPSLEYQPNWLSGSGSAEYKVSRLLCPKKEDSQQDDASLKSSTPGGRAVRDSGRITA